MKRLLFSAVSLETGGIEKALVTLLNYLSHQRANGESKYEITLVLERKEGIFLNELNKNIKILEYRPSNNKIEPLRKFINLCKRLKFKSKYNNKFDYACSYATYSLPAAFVATTASENTCLWVHSEYMSMFKNNEKEYINFFEKLHIQEFKKIVFVSNNSREIFVNTFKKIESIKPQYKDIEEKTEVIHNLIDYTEIVTKSNEKVEDVNKREIYTFLHVGRQTEEEKKITRILKSAQKLKEDGYKFRILLVGKGKNTEDYKKEAKNLNIENEVIFLGQKKNPYPYFKLSNCLILTSEYEGFPVVYTEAFILELPIITTDVSDAKTEIEGKYGIVVEKNINSIYNAMKEAIEKGITIKEKFDYKRYNMEIIEKITKLINN